MKVLFLKLKETYLKQRLWLLLVLISLALLVACLVPLLLWAPILEVVSQPEKIKVFVLSFGNLALIVYVLLSIVVIVIPPLPNEIVPVVGGMILGFWPALIFGLLARIIGSTINYWLGKQIRKGVYIKLISKEEQDRLKGYTEKIGWQAVFLSRFTPSTDVDLIAYVAGMANMKYIPFILASFFGMLLPVSAMILIGSSLINNKVMFYILAIAYVVGMLFAHKIIRKLIKLKIFSKHNSN